MASFRIGVVQPITVPPPDDEANVARPRLSGSRGRRRSAPISSASRRIIAGPSACRRITIPPPLSLGPAPKHHVHAVFNTIEPIDPAKTTAYT